MISSSKKALLASTLLNRSGLVVEDVFSTYLYTGTGYSQRIKNGINLAGSPSEAVDQTLLDVFSTDLYTGNGSTQTITNGIDLAGEGGLVWIKSRPSTEYHELRDNIRGLTKTLRSNLTDAEATIDVSLAFNSDGWSINTNRLEYNNSSGSYSPYVSWTFRRAPNFFDVVTYTGDGTGTRAIPHSLGIAPGMFIVKNTGSGAWYVYHKDGVATTYTGAETYGVLNSTNAWTDNAAIFGDTEPTDAVFTVGSQNNQSANTYVAYLFAHDTSGGGIIQCGSFTTDGSGNASVTLGYEPQWVMWKSSTFSDLWQITDNMRGWANVSGGRVFLRANASDAETVGNEGFPTSTGFEARGMSGLQTYIYMAIRKPSFDGSSGGLVWIKNRDGNDTHIWTDTERGATKYISSSLAPAAQITDPDTLTSFNTDGFSIGADIKVNTNTEEYVAWSFKKTERFFDVVTYTGTGSNRTVSHNLGVAPGIILIKVYDNNYDWFTYSADIPNTQYLTFGNGGLATTDTTYWNSTAATDTEFSLGSATNVNGSGQNFVAYLFANDPETSGIIKTGSYVGNGSTTGTIVTTGWVPQLILIQNVSTTGGSFILDTVRGIFTGGSDWALLPTSEGGDNFIEVLELTADGFQLKNAFGKNVSGDTYIYVAIREA
jgi:hypothetical protein